MPVCAALVEHSHANATNAAPKEVFFMVITPLRGSMPNGTQRLYSGTRNRTTTGRRRRSTIAPLCILLVRMLPSPIEPILAERGCVVLDGALATELERAGCDLRDPLWSAKVLIEAPERIRAVHASYFAAGADCATTATYQATFEGFARRGLDANGALAMFQRAVDLAALARDEFWSDATRREGRSKPFVAASIGSYGAYLADGSEYRGDYGLDAHALLEFHLPRMAVLAASGADMFALETIPSLLEARALVRALRIVRDMPAWLSFSCRDGEHTCHGERIADCVAELAGCEQLVAIGINCT